MNIKCINFFNVINNLDLIALNWLMTMFLAKSKLYINGFYVLFYLKLYQKKKFSTELYLNERIYFKVILANIINSFIKMIIIEASDTDLQNLL